MIIDDPKIKPDSRKNWVDQPEVRDEYFHIRSDDPYWSENTLWSFNVPERNLVGLIYCYFRPNMNLVVAGPVVWDHTGEDVFNCLYYGWDQHLAMPKDCEMFDFTLSNSLSCKMIEPQKKYHWTYDRHDYKFDLVWTALAEPHYMKLDKSGEESPGIKNWVARDGDLPVGHYEQAGRFKGWIEVEGERIEIDSGALRDRGWGPRHADVADPLRAGWPYCFHSEKSSWHLYDPQLGFTWRDDPIEGTIETVTSGFYVRDGIKAYVVSGTRKAERGRDGRVLTQVIHAKDELGRELHAVGKSLNWIKWPVNSDIVVWWSLVRWEYDGMVVYGEDQDFMNFRHYRRYWKKLLARDPGIMNFFPPNDPDYPPYGKK